MKINGKSIGLFLGVITGILIANFLFSGSNDHGITFQIFEAEDGLKVARVFHNDGKDQIVFEDVDNKGMFNLPLETYLERYFHDEATRKIKKIEIRELVKWYKH